METGDYETNTVLSSTIASVAFRLYELPQDHLPDTTPVIFDVESSLRIQGRVVTYDANRRAFWLFRLRYKNDNRPWPPFEPSLTVSGHLLRGGEEGSLDPINLQKNLPSNLFPSSQTPASSAATDLSQRSAGPAGSEGSRAGSHERSDSKATVTFSDSQKLDPATQHNSIYEFFVTAVLSSTTTLFCAQSGALPLSYRTLLLSTVSDRNDRHGEAQPDTGSALGTLHAYMTTAGALVVSISVAQCRSLAQGGDVDSSLQSRHAPVVLAAPFGILAGLQPPRFGEPGLASLAQTPTTQALFTRRRTDTRESQWKQKCAEAMERRGIDASLLVDCVWRSLSVTGRRALSNPKRPQPSPSGATFLWPAPLCFSRKVFKVSGTNRIGETLSSGQEDSHDHLSGVSTWFNGTAEREERLAKHRHERVAMALEPTASELKVQKPNGQSPAAFRRPSTAAGAMYPTPPDALQNPNGVTPSFDGTSSSPGNQAVGSTAMEVDATIHGSVPEPAVEPFAENVFADTKRERSDSNLLESADNIFEDMGGGMFEENDITEDDFNFFDEEPDEDGMDLVMTEPPEVPANDAPVVDPVIAPHPALKQTIPAAVPREMPKPEKPVFAKPELKHARSSQTAEAAISRVEESSRSVKRERSPFNPDAVFKRVCASMSSNNSSSSQMSRRTSKVFEMLDFGPTLPKINKKYEKGGLYDFTQFSRIEIPQLSPGSLPETDYLKRHSGRGQRRRDGPPGSVMFKGMYGAGGAAPRPSPVKSGELVSDAEDSSLDSDEDDSSYTTEDPSSPVKSSGRPAAIEDDVASQVASLRDGDLAEEPNQTSVWELPAIFNAGSKEPPLSKYFSDPEPVILDMSLPDEDIVQIAQILTEQAATGFLAVFEGQDDGKDLSLKRGQRQSLASSSRASMVVLRQVASQLFNDTASASLKGLLDVQDAPIVGQPSRLQPRPVAGRDTNADLLRPSSLYPIPGSHVEVRRAESKHSVLPSAVSFWEGLGLAPASGGKDITAACVFPGFRGVHDNVKEFLTRMKSVYELLKLGHFESLPLAGDVDPGVVSYEVDKISTSPDITITGHGTTLMDSIETLQAAMCSLAATKKNVVVFFAYAPSNPGTIVEACTAFQRFFEGYQGFLKSRKETPQNEVVLQLVSAEVISSPTKLMVTPMRQLARLCLEMYDRCTLFSGPMPAPAIRLEQALPRMIDFKASNTPSASLIHENSCIHVAYAQSIDERWVTAAWTDERGNQQGTASYCLGRKGQPLATSMNDVAHEIWESTLEMISIWKVHWRIIITKCSPMDQAEMSFWVDLAKTEIKAHVTMILMTVDAAPSLQLIPPAVRLPPSSQAFYTTPVSTPQANVLSPEQAAGPSTPAREGESGAATDDPEAGATLVDATDQTWGAVLGHRLSNSVTVQEMQPSLMSGYLIKKTGIRIDDPPVLMEVNLVHAEANPRAYEPLLREMMSNFRALGTLARARGIVDKEVDIRPWHVAAAEKAARALYLLM